MSGFSGLSRLAMVGVVLAATAPIGGARAQELTEDDMPDTKIIRGILEGFGLRGDGSGIEYRERSPLVVPPVRTLPPPETASAATRNAAWPVDPDETARKQAKRKTSGPVDEDRPLTPAQLRRGVTRSEAAAQPASNDSDANGRPLRPSELGSQKNIWNLFGRGKSEEVVPFTGEPPRASLTVPPSGYQTPSPNQPYGITTAAPVKPSNPMDRGTVGSPQ